MFNKKIFTSHSKTGLLLTIFFTFTIVFVFYHQVLLSPNTYLINDKQDAIKNYFNYAWQIKNGTSVNEFSGMSYPFGETLILEDSLPFWSSILRPVCYLFPFLNQYVIGFLNLLLLLSFVFGAIFMFLVFRHFNLPQLISALSANAVVFLSSQVLLLYPSGHWGLTFVCFFPIGWYLILRFSNSTKKLKWSILIGLNILFWSFTHLYLGLILCIFTMGVHFIQVLFKYKKYPFNWKTFVHVGIQVFLPISIIFLLIKTLDCHPDRIDMPFLTTYTTSPNLVFLPVLSPFRPIYNMFFDLSKQQELVWSRTGNYIGLTTNLAIIVFVLMIIWLIVRRKFNRIKDLLPIELYIYLLSGIFLLFFAMAIPQRFFSQNFIDCLPPLKQFSSLGRFAWAFYFVIVTAGIIFFFRILYKQWVGKILFAILLFILFIEGFSYQKQVSSCVGQLKNPFSVMHIENSDTLLLSLDAHKYQAILPIPYYFQFNLSFGSSGSDKSIYASMVASYHSGLPIMSTYLSRPSVSESLEIYKQLMPAPYRAMLPRVVADGRDLAVIIPVSDTALMNANERNIQAMSKLVAIDSSYLIYSLSVDSLMKQNRIESRFLTFDPKNDTNKFQVYLSFDSLNCDLTYKGSGAYRGLKKDFNLVYRTSTESMDTTKDYLLTFWYYNCLWDQTFTSLIISEDENGKNLQYRCISPLDALIIDGYWYLNQHRFRIISKSSTLSIFFQGDDYFKDWFLIDELSIRAINIAQK
jgi:hypothetical protein